MTNTWKIFSKCEGVARTGYMNLKLGKQPMNIRRKVLPIRSVRLQNDTVVLINAYSVLEGFLLELARV